MSEPYIGQIILFGGNFAIRGFAKCDGQLLSISNNTALFSILGTTYGGDGETSFGLPDLRGRVALHYGNGPGLPGVQLGQKSGNPDTTLGVANLPPHNHTLSPRCNSGAADSDTPVGNFPAVDEGATESYHSGNNAAMGQSATNTTGSGQSFSNMPPYTAVNYLIALIGVFPSQN
jgi:microcystin-dependent protein